MTSVVHVTIARNSIVRHQWVRLTRGAYKGDVAQVMETFDGGARLLIRCIPRIDLKVLALPPGQRRGTLGRGAPRPPQRYFDRAEIMETTGNTANIESK